MAVRIERAEVREQIEKLIAESAAQHRMLNADLAVSLNESGELVWRGYRYEVPPLPWALAVQMIQVQEGLDRVAKGQGGADEYRRNIAKAVRLFRQAVRPRGIRRPFWSVLPNPFRAATVQEVGQLLGFFCACLMMPTGARPAGRNGR